MAAWRRRALEYFPQLRAELQRAEYTIYMLFFDLLPMVRADHESGDAELARRIYEFAEWCLNQTTGDLSNAAGVAFYEHLFDSNCHRAATIRRLSPDVIATCRPLWEARLSAHEMAELRPLIPRQIRRG
jgi:hypothetical protein